MEKVFYVKDSDMKVPVKMWLKEYEEEALEQAVSVSKLPFVYKHVALMPDMHLGYGVPIGCVFATEDVIIPNAVGVDIGCIDCDTEFLTRSGWKKIKDWDKDEVLQYDKDKDLANFTLPERYIVEPCEEFYHFKTKYGMDMMLSEEHKMLLYLGYKGRGYTVKDWEVGDFVKHHVSLNKGVQGGIKTVFDLESDTKLNVSDNDIRMIVMVSADGCIRKRKTVLDGVELHFRKERKINRAKYILDKCNIEYDLTVGKDGSTFIYFKSEAATKDLSMFWGANSHQLKVLAEEVMFWDGHVGLHEFYSTTITNHADIIQFAFAVSGIRANIQEYDNESNKGKLNSYMVYKTQNNIVCFSKDCISKVQSKDGKKYCFTVPSGYFVARRNGKIFITGNCGICSLKLPIKDISIEEMKKIFGGSSKYKGGIRSKIPVGMKHHSSKQSERYMPDIEINFEEDNLPIVKREYYSALKQIGTLGGGNHFIEFQKGDDGYIYIMIHSGSRNLGYSVAKHYNELSKRMCKKWHVSDDIIKADLAYLPVDSKEGRDYIEEMNYCVEFSFKNRLLMMKRVVEEVVNVIPGADVNVEDNIVNIAHNYASLEYHFGRNVWVHRKGATRVTPKIIGLIPGSQGSNSYIVRGKDTQENTNSFNSCSHGAGRLMSRKKAKENLDIEEEEKILEDAGVMLHTIRGKNSLDEAPSAYKDISEVMNNQRELVEILVELSPIACIKG